MWTAENKLGLAAEDQQNIVLGGPNSTEKLEHNIIDFVVTENTLRQEKMSDFSSYDLPYEDQCPKAILERWRLLQDFNLGGEGVSSDYTLVTLMNALLDSEPIKKALNTFKYFRSKIEVRIVSSSSIYDYGLAFACHVPYLTFTPSVPYSWISSNSPYNLDWSRIMNHNPAILDVSQQQELTYEVPWVSPAMWIDLQAYYDTLHPNHSDLLTATAAMSRFTVFISTPFGTLSDVKTDIPFKMYARFKNPIVQGFLPENTGAIVAEAQMFTGAASLAGAAVLNSGVTNAVSGWASARIAEGAKAGTNFLMNKVDESVDCWWNGNCGESEISQNEERSNVSTFPDPYGDLVGRSAPAKKLAEWPDNGVTSHSIIDYLRVPSILEVYEFTNGGTDIHFLWTRPEQMVDSRIHWMSQFFRFWRGSVVFTVHFVTSPLVSGRFALSLRYLNSEDESDHVTKVVTIRGSDVVSFQIPYLYLSPFQRTQIVDSGLNSGPLFSIKKVSDLISQRGISPSVQVFVWVHAGKDFQFHSLCSGGSSGSVDSPLKAEAQMFACDFASVDEPAFEASTRTPFGKEGVRTLEDIGKRYDAWLGVNVVNPKPYWATDGWVESPNCDSISALFLFFRGSMDMKWICSPPADPADPSSVFIQYEGANNSFPSSYSTLANGTVIQDVRLNPVLEMNFPAMGKYDWYPIPENVSDMLLCDNEALPTLNIITDPEVTILHTVRRFGPRVGFFYSLPPPYLGFWPKNRTVEP